MKERISKIASIYGISDSEVRQTILSHLQFAGYDHSRVIEQAIQAYGKDNEPLIKKAILSFPQFAGLDHSRVLNQLGRIGRIAGLEIEEVKQAILSRPILAGYSTVRYLAVIDVFRQLAREKDLTMHESKDFVKIWLSYASKSPYVPETKKLRISEAQKIGINVKPPLYHALKNRVCVFKL
ncbi:MAG: hypothetical protein V1728_05395 [Candidatus Micrarchaeota archaeon]